MRFLIVLALIKCAVTYSVIDPSNHKTVSVPIGNDMNVDIDVTVDVNTGGNEQCQPKGGNCCCWPCCPGLVCKDIHTTHSKCIKKTETDNDCTIAGDTCETSSECCEYPGTTMTCKKSGLGDKRCMNAKDQKCHANEGEGCAYDDDCCEEDNICAGEWGYRREAFTQKCQLKPEQCSANKGEECLSDHDCCEKDHVCHVIMKEKRSYCGLKDDYPKPNDCIADGEPCHGTDDWVHECCSESCCEGKCGTCGTPWYKRS